MDYFVLLLSSRWWVGGRYVGVGWGGVGGGRGAGLDFDCSRQSDQRSVLQISRRPAPTDGQKRERETIVDLISRRSFVCVCASMCVCVCVCTLLPCPSLAFSYDDDDDDVDAEE